MLSFLHLALALRPSVSTNRYWHQPTPLRSRSGSEIFEESLNRGYRGRRQISPARSAGSPDVFPRPQVTPYDDAGMRAFESRSLYVNDIVLRFAVNTGTMDAPIQRAFAEIDPNLTVIRIQTFATQVDSQLSQETLIVRLTSLFGLTALLLASIGLYGVTSYSVARHRSD